MLQVYKKRDPYIFCGLAVTNYVWQMSSRYLAVSKKYRITAYNLKALKQKTRYG